MAGEIATEEEEGLEPPPGARPQWLSSLTERWRREREELEAYIANAASFQHVSVAISNTFICPRCGPGRCDGTTLDCTLDSYYANPANGPRPSASGGTAQNPSPYGAWPGYSYPATRYDDAPPTERLPAPPPLRCECGTGDHTRSAAHSHWCPCWVSA
jgi:hypothetical protein